VANYSAEEIITLDNELKQYSIPLTTNQCEFSILRRYPEISGLIETCRAREIVFQSYSSLAQGRLSGKYSAKNPAPKTRRFSSYPAKDIKNTLKVLRSIGHARGKTPASIALNYNMVKGAIPTIGIRKLKHAEDVIAALGWRLSNEELRRIDLVSMVGKTTIT
jgi:aryl-alcohol dehydrogenase-like predicted oxidoreductase